MNETPPEAQECSSPSGKGGKLGAVIVMALVGVGQLVGALKRKSQA